MENNDSISDEKFWLRKIQQYWKMFVLALIGAAVAVVGAVIVLFWHMETSPIGNQGTATIGDWRLSWIWIFFIVLILWELLFVGAPAAVAAGLVYYFWWNKLPEEEKEMLKSREKESKTARNGAGGFGFVMFIAYSIYMYINGYFDTPFSAQPYTFWIYQWFLTLGWLLIIFGIPAAIILIIVYFKIWRKEL
jgi:MFS family permease